MSENVVIKKDRTVTVPASEAKIGVQYDHNVNVITFDCPRYPDDDRNVDMSTMQIYINYMLPDKTLGSYLAENVKVDTNNPDTIHFDWKITRNVTQVKGALQALVCIKKVDAEGNELYHWNTDLIQSFRVGEGMECLETISSDYADVISQLLVNMNTVTGEFEALSADVTARTSEETLQGLVNNVASDEKLGSIVDAYMEANPVGINVDDTLTVSGDAADAKITGDRITELKSDIAQKLDAFKKSEVTVQNKNYKAEGSNIMLNYDLPENSYSVTVTKGTSSKLYFYDAENVETSKTFTVAKGESETFVIPSNSVLLKSASSSATTTKGSIDVVCHEPVNTNEILADIADSVKESEYVERLNLLRMEDVTDNLEVQPFQVVTNTARCSAYLKIETGQKLFVNYGLGTPTAWLCDENKAKIEWVSLPFSNNDVARNTGYEVTTENVKYIRLSWQKDRASLEDIFFSLHPIRYKLQDEQFVKQSIPDLNTGILDNFWFMKRGDSLGDSLTGQGHFQSWTRRFFGLERFSNHGIGGTRLSGPANTYGDSMWMDSRINVLKEDADFVTVLGGQNDTNATIGEISKANKNTDTIVGALNTIIDKIYARCGADVIIILCTPFWVPSEGADGERFVGLDNAFREVAKLHGLPVADFGGLSMADYNNADRYWGTDKTHPLELFYKERIAPVLISTMKSINPIDWEQVNYYE